MIDAHCAARGPIAETRAANARIARKLLRAAKSRGPSVPLRLHPRRCFQHRIEGRRRDARPLVAVAERTTVSDAATIARKPRRHLAIHGLAEQPAHVERGVLGSAGAFAGKLVERAQRTCLQQPRVERRGRTGERGRIAGFERGADRTLVGGLAGRIAKAVAGQREVDGTGVVGRGCVEERQRRRDACKLAGDRRAALHHVGVGRR